VLSPGDICWVHLTFPQGDSEGPCRRPAVVLQASELDDALPTVLVVPLTLEVDALRLPGTVPVEPDLENGLARSLVALVFQLTAVDRELIHRTSGRVSAAALEAIREELDRVSGRGEVRPPAAAISRERPSREEEGLAPERSFYDP